MKKIYQILFFTFLALKVAGQVPDNDDCANAINLTVGTEVSGTTKNATDSELGCSGVLDVWYKFKATSTQHSLIVTPISAQNYVFVAVASGSSCNNLSCDVFNRNYDYNQPIKILLDNLTKDVDYYIKLSSQYGSSGYDFNLVVQNPSDLCNNAITVTCSNPQNFNVAGTGAFLSVGCTDGSENSDNNGKEVIYKFTPSVDGNYLIQLTAADGNRVSYYLKETTSNCGSTGWQCLGNIGSLADIVDNDGNGSGLALDNLIACQEYYLLLDAPTTNTVNQTFKIVNSFSGDCSGLDCITLTSPISGSSNVSTKPNFEWTPVLNAHGYRLTLGTTFGGNDIVDNIDLGNTTVYQQTTSLPPNSTIYVTLKPYSCSGESPEGCNTFSFQTVSAICGLDDIANNTGNMISFDGINQYVQSDINTNNKLNNTSFTIECWVKFANTSAGKSHFITEIGQENGNVGPWLWYNNNNDFGAGFNWLHLGFGGGLDIKYPFYPCVNTWYHLAYVYDHNAQSTTLYINGVSQGSKPQNGFNPFFNEISQPRIFLGRRTNSLANSNLNGSMDEFRLWGIARTANEISQNYQKELTGNEPGLNVYYKFDDISSGTHLSNCTPFSIHGNIVGGVSLNASLAPLTQDVNCQAIEINDNCGNARTITVLPNGTTNCTGGLLSQTTAGATPTTTGGLTSCVTNQDDIYYKFTTTVAGNYSVRFCNVTAAYGTLDSYIGFSDLTDCITRRLYCGGPTISNGSASIVMENLAANSTYLFAVWSPGENNALNFDVSVIAPAILSPPSNDECSGAIAFPTIVPNPNLLVPADGACSIVTVQTEGSTVSNTTPCIASEGDVWYKFTMPQGNYVLKYRMVATQNRIQVYSGTCGNLTTITDCLSNAIGFLNSLSSGQTYYLRVYRVGYQQNSTTEICLQTLLDADDCENAFVFPEIPTDKTCSTLRLSTLNTRPSSVPWCKSNTLDNDTWGKFIIPATGVRALKINTSRVAGTFNYAFQVFLGDCGNLKEVLCSTIEGIIPEVFPGQTYYVRLFSTDAFNATIDFCLVKTPKPSTFAGGDWTDVSKWTPSYVGTHVTDDDAVTIIGNATANIPIINDGSIISDKSIEFSSFVNNSYTAIKNSDITCHSCVNNGNLDFYESSISCYNCTNNGTLNFSASIDNSSFMLGSLTNTATGLINVYGETNLFNISDTASILANYGTIFSRSRLANFSSSRIDNYGRLVNDGAFVCDMDNFGAFENRSAVLGDIKINSNSDFLLEGYYYPANVIKILPSISFASNGVLTIFLNQNFKSRLESSGDIHLRGVLQITVDNLKNGNYTIIKSTGGKITGNFTEINYSINGVPTLTLPPGMTLRFTENSVDIVVLNSLTAKIYLEGPLSTTISGNSVIGLMNDDLRTKLDNNNQSLIPTKQPYFDEILGFKHVGGSGYETIDSTLLDTIGNNAIIDWVFIELSRSPSAAEITRSALLQRDGDIVDLDGKSPVVFDIYVNTEYYLTIRHRNHLAIKTIGKIIPAKDSLDFTKSDAYQLVKGEDKMKVITLSNGTQVCALWAGDVLNDGEINASDRSQTWNDRNKTGYLDSDCNMDGETNASDRSATWNNRNKKN